MACTVTRSLVFLQSGTCLAKECFNSFYDTLKKIQESRRETFDSLVQFSRNPRRGVSFSVEDLTYLREQQILKEHDRVDVTVVEILKSCYCPQTKWCTEDLREEVVVSRQQEFSEILKRERAKKVEIEPIKPKPPIQVEPPTNDEILDILQKIKGNNDVLQDLIAKGGMLWKVEICTIRYSFRKGDLKGLLCEKALREDDVELLEKVLELFTPEEISSQIESLFSSHKELCLQTHTGHRLLRAHSNLRHFLLRELLPGNYSAMGLNLRENVFLKEVLSPIEFQGVIKRKTPCSLLHTLMTLRIQNPDFEKWCLNYIKEPALREYLKPQEIIDVLLKMPPSIYRSRMALEVTVHQDFIHKALETFSFRFKEPEDTPNYIVSIDGAVDRYLEKCSLAKNFKAIELIRDNFGFLLGNKKGVGYLNRYFDSEQLRKDREEWNQFIDSFKVRDEVPSRNRNQSRISRRCHNF